MLPFGHRRGRAGSKGAGTRSESRTPGKRRLRLVIESLEERWTPATSVWSGAVDALWSTAGNWDVAPETGDDLSFPAGASNLQNTDDLSGDRQFGVLNFGGANYKITTASGSSLTLTGGIAGMQNTGTSTLEVPLTLSTSATVDVLNQPATVVLAGPITTAVPFQKTGAGRLVLAGTSGFSVPTTVTGGELTVNGSLAQSTVSVSNGGSLDGEGSVGPVNVNDGAIRGGGFDAPGIFTVGGDLNLNSGSVFSVLLQGSTAGTGYGQVKASGAVNITGSTLNPTLSFTPTLNQSFMIIENTGNSATTGTFDGLPEGATLTIGGESFHLTYQGGTGNDVVLSHVVSSSTVVQASTTTPVFGQTVTFTATVASNGGPTPTGGVEFFDGSTSLGVRTLSSGVASIDVSALSLGGHSITAHYEGDDANASSTSEAITVTVAAANVTNVLSALPTSSVFGQNVTLSATLLPVAPGSGLPTGTVEFFVGSTSLGTSTVNVSGVASLGTTALPLGASTITAKFTSNDGRFNSADSQPLNFAVGQSVTNTVMTALPNPSALGAAVTLTATVSAATPGSGTPTGSVRFLNGSTEIGIATLSNGVASLDTSSLPGGTLSLTAQYLGDVNFAAGTSPVVSHQVTPAATTTTVSVDPTASVFGQSVTITATVASGTAGPAFTGNVQFFAGSTSLGTAPVTNGVAKLTTTALPLGTNSVTAAYPGDNNYFSSTSSAVTQTVTRATTLTILSATPNPGVVGQTIALQARVGRNSPATGDPTGTVQFFNGSTLLGTATLTAGVATLNIATLPLGTTNVTATYSGDANDVGGTSDPLAVVINQGATVVTVTLSNSAPPAYGRVTITASVKPAAGSGTVTGSVRFFANGLDLGAAPISSGAASLTTRNLPIGATSIVAVYSGDVNNLTSASTGLDVVVGSGLQIYLNQLFVVSMSRQIDLQSMLYWENRFAGGMSEGRIAASIYNSREAKLNAVRNNYKLYLNRDSTSAETQGGFRAESSAKFGSKPIVLGSASYYRTVAGGTTDGFVLALGTSITGSPFSSTIQASLKRSLQGGASRQAVATQALGTLASRQALVMQSYQAILGRDATDAEVTSGAKTLLRRSLRQFNTGLISSTEFFDTYTQTGQG